MIMSTGTKVCYIHRLWERSLKSLLAILKFRLEHNVQITDTLTKYHLQRKNIVTSLLLQWNLVVIMPGLSK